MLTIYRRIVYSVLPRTDMAILKIRGIDIAKYRTTYISIFPDVVFIWLGV